jgi:hypothetical protein
MASSSKRGRGVKSYREDDRGLGRKFGRNIDVHLEVRWVRSKVVDASKSAIYSCADSGYAAEY